MRNRLKGKFAIITGATAGMGKVIAQLFAESGCNIAITGRREERLQSLKKALESSCDIEVRYRVFDVRDREAAATS